VYDSSLLEVENVERLIQHVNDVLKKALSKSSHGLYTTKEEYLKEEVTLYDARDM
jgi:hypothetical protein